MVEEEIKTKGHDPEQGIYRPQGQFGIGRDIYIYPTYTSSSGVVWNRKGCIYTYTHTHIYIYISDVHIVLRGRLESEPRRAQFAEHVSNDFLATKLDALAMSFTVRQVGRSVLVVFQGGRGRVKGWVKGLGEWEGWM